MQNYDAIVALGNWCNDYVIVANDVEISEIMKQYNIREKGVFLTNNKNTFFNIQSTLSKICNSYNKWCCGGSVNNSLQAASLYKKKRGAGVPLIWVGEHGASPLFLCTNDSQILAFEPLSVLRRSGVKIVGRRNKELQDLSICIIDEKSRETKYIIIYSPTARSADMPEVEVSNYLLLLHINDFIANPKLIEQHLKKASGIAVALGDPVKNIDSDLMLRRGYESECFCNALSSGKINFVAGKTSDLKNCGFLDDSENANLKYKNVEIIATNSNEYVKIWDVINKCSNRLKINTKIIPSGSTLGAGDAYFGAYISARIQGVGIEKAHFEAQDVCSDVLSIIDAQVLMTVNLNQIFPKSIERSSESYNEGEFYNRVRLSAGFTIITGGQTGVDQIAIKTSEKLGLPVYAIMPKDRRTNNTDVGMRHCDNLGEAMILELESKSYRYRTWASVYFSDGTIIWDFCDSEGTKAAVDACEYLCRPYILVNKIKESERLKKIVDWALRNCINVLNFAGNRASLIPNGSENIIADEMYATMKKLAWINNVGARHLTPTVGMVRLKKQNHQRRKKSDFLRIGLPKTPVHINFFNLLFMHLYGIKLENSRKLKQSFTDIGLTFYFSRPRDLPDMLKSDMVDIAFMGSDLIDEYGLDWKHILLNTGLFTMFLGTVSKDPETMLNINCNSETIVSQYPTIAKSVHGNRIKHILGSAELWVVEDKAITAFDSWRTGATAFDNGLTAFSAYGSYSLVIITDEYHQAKIKDNDIFNNFIQDAIDYFRF
jgi:hypothetical protein